MHVHRHVSDYFLIFLLKEAFFFVKFVILFHNAFSPYSCVRYIALPHFLCDSFHPQVHQSVFYLLQKIIIYFVCCEPPTLMSKLEDKFHSFFFYVVYQLIIFYITIVSCIFRVRDLVTYLLLQLSVDKFWKLGKYSCYDNMGWW